MRLLNRCSDTLLLIELVTVAAHTVLQRSNTMFVSSNLTRTMCGCVPYFCNCVVLCNERKNNKIKIYRTTILPVVLCGCETMSYIEGRT
jgi:hypothetical protein